jgi:hypothetical protein
MMGVRSERTYDGRQAERNTPGFTVMALSSKD